MSSLARAAQGETLTTCTKKKSFIHSAKGIKEIMKLSALSHVFAGLRVYEI
jgi:hypothetical protein